MFVALLLFLSVVLGVLKLGGLLALSWWLVSLPALIAVGWCSFIFLVVVIVGILRS